MRGDLHGKGASGKPASRPKLARALAPLWPGDTLVITRLSRAMRSLRHLLELAARLSGRKVHLQVLKQGLARARCRAAWCSTRPARSVSSSAS